MKRSVDSSTGEPSFRFVIRCSGALDPQQVLTVPHGILVHVRYSQRIPASLSSHTAFHHQVPGSWISSHVYSLIVFSFIGSLAIFSLSATEVARTVYVLFIGSLAFSRIA